MNAIARIFRPAPFHPKPADDFDLSEFDALTDEDFDAPFISESPTERDLREAEEAIARYDLVIAGCDQLVASTQAQKAEATRLRAGRKAQIAAIEQKAVLSAAPEPARKKGRG